MTCQQLSSSVGVYFLLDCRNTPKFFIPICDVCVVPTMQISKNVIIALGKQNSLSLTFNIFHLFDSRSWIYSWTDSVNV